MAIVSISRIQIRRGRKNAGSGLPQLAGGELGWAVDTQELFIGNGAVSEGAPAVGNSKVLTEHDNLFELSDQYTYRNGSNIQTGATSATPIRRSLQSRLDDEVSARSFGATGDGTTDDTASLQRAVDQLYLPWSSSQDADNYKKRITLSIPAGLYSISNSIKLPPYATLIGDGSGKTVITQTGAFPVFETINGEGIAAQTTSINQATNITLSGITLQSNTTHPGLKLASCKDSSFNDIHVKGPWVQSQGAAIEATQVGILLEATSTPVTSKNNSFNKVTVTGFSYAVLSNHDVHMNNFNNSVFESCGYGLVFGRDTVLGQVAQATGPFNNATHNSKFSDINLQAIWIKEGYGNISSRNTFSKVGNDAGLDSAPVHSVIKFEKNGNTSKHDYFSRTSALILPMGATPYIPEIEGIFKGEFTYSTDLPSIGLLNSFETIIRLPAGKNLESNPGSGVFDIFYHKTFEISYQTKMGSGNGMRQGTLTILIDKENQTSHISDNFDYQGTDVDLLTFTAQLVDHNIDADFETLEIKAKNPSSVPLTDVKIQIRSFS